MMNIKRLLLLGMLLPIVTIFNCGEGYSVQELELIAEVKDRVFYVGEGYSEQEYALIEGRL